MLLYRDRRRAHATLFGGEHRKANVTPEFHNQIVDDFHSDIRNLCVIAFRGAAKSTIAEEGIVIRACFREFRHCLIVSSTSDIAEMRLHAIKRQFETNESIIEIFGNLKSQPWGDNQIELSSGVVIRAVGRGQAIRGTKDEDVRPDFILVDDLEDSKSVANETQLKKTLAWFDGELVGSADKPTLHMRMLANDMGPDCLANKLKPSDSGWIVKVYPWVVKDDQGRDRAIWEDRYPLAMCMQTKRELYGRGSGDEYEREYMCSSERPEAKTFRDDMLKVDARVRVYDPVYAMIVPEKMQSGLQATLCAGAAWSWQGEKIIVWESWVKNISASEIIAETKRMDAQYRPIKIGAMNPAYQDWMRPSLSLPNIAPIKLQSDELDFVRALQPFFVCKQIIFATDPRETWQSFLSFPNGPIEGPRALAFALHPLLHDATPIYSDFDSSNIAPDMIAEPGALVLALNADDTIVGGVLCQVSGKGLRIFCDWIATGDATDLAPAIMQQANVFAQRRCQVIMPARHFEKRTGRLPLALSRYGVQAGAGGPTDSGRAELRKILREKSKGVPRFLVSEVARWTMNGFLSGYTIDTKDGPYKLMVEAAESFAALMSLGELDTEDRTNATTKDGRSYFSARPVKQNA